LHEYREPDCQPGTNPRRGFVDIHAHVLPGLDDGPADQQQSLAMLHMAHTHGTSVLVASPHANPFYSYDPDRVDQCIDRLRPIAPSGLQLIRGCDFHLTFNNVENALRCPSKFAINGRTYLLMELSELTVFANTDALWSRLEQAGLRIILTHPERNPLLRQRIDVIERWVDSGRFMQVTAGSLLGHFGPEAQRFSIRMLDSGLVHFVASDAHDLQHRPPRLDEAFQWLSENYSAEFAACLTIDNPAAAVEGAPLAAGRLLPPRPAAGTPWWRRFLRLMRRGRNNSPGN
jgi:protein-tyrosine phosphatase